MLDAMDKSLITNTLVITFGNQIKAARLLGINRNTLRAKIKKLGISIDEVKR
jgi:DNA-binding protein Fis